MRELFPGFYNRTDIELSKCWLEGIFVFDTNMLLNVYRYTQTTRDRYLEILEILKKQNQLWIPYQVAYEYQDRRIKVIQGQLDAYTEVATILQNTAQKLENSLSTYQNKHEFIQTEKIIEDINSVIEQAKSTVTQSKAKDKKKYEALKNQDKLLEKLEELFQDNVGSSYTSEKLGELYRQAQIRIELKIPPGWEDEDKKGYRRYGDIILWFQLLDYARYQKKPIIFITDDGKKDWWIRDSQGKPIRPLPELIQEMFVEASVLLHMYQGYEFLKAAVHFLKLEEKPEIIEEAKDVSEQNAMETNLARRRMIPEKSIESRAYFAVLEWLESLFPESKLIQQPGSAFLIEELNGKVIDVVVNFSFDPIFPQKIRESIFRYFRGMRGMPTDKQMLVLVFSSSELADRVAENALKDLTTIPTNISLVVGYLTDDIRFINISVIGCPLTTSDKDQGDKLQ